MQEGFVTWVLGELEARGWSQAELARRASVTPAPISRMLSGQTESKPEVLAGIARAFGVPLEEILRRAGQLPPYVDLPDGAKDWGTRLMALPEGLRAATIRAMAAALELAEATGPPAGRKPRR